MDKELLFKSNLTEFDIEIPGRGTVRARVMTRDELHTLRKGAEKDTGLAERRVLAACMIDPELSEAEVLQWQTMSSVGEVALVVDAIMAESGLTAIAEAADKSSV